MANGEAHESVMIVKNCWLNQDRGCDSDCPCYFAYSGDKEWEQCVLLRSAYRFSEAAVSLSISVSKLVSGFSNMESNLSPPKVNQ